MKKNNQNSKNTNASAASFGFQFQIAAGLILMLDNIKEFTSIKIEGKTEDIEITLKSGKIYAQAKSVIQIDDNKNASSKLKKTLASLSRAAEIGDAVSLIY
jgi:collagenase-like PrtC family protease